MSKTKHAVKVSELPFIDSVRELSIGDRKRLGLILPSGHVNDYRIAHMNGTAGSRKEETFDPSLGRRGGHSCCGSRVEWRHKVTCPRLNFGDEPQQPPGDSI